MIRRHTACLSGRRATFRPDRRHLSRSRRTRFADRPASTPAPAEALTKPAPHQIRDMQRVQVHWPAHASESGRRHVTKSRASAAPELRGRSNSRAHLLLRRRSAWVANSDNQRISGVTEPKSTA